jgi:hypothetical protein
MIHAYLFITKKRKVTFLLFFSLSIKYLLGSSCTWIRIFVLFKDLTLNLDKHERRCNGQFIKVKEPSNKKNIEKQDSFIN